MEVYLQGGKYLKMEYLRDLNVAATPFTDQGWHHYVIRGVDLSAWTQFRINGYTGAWDNEGYFDDIRIYNTNLI